MMFSCHLIIIERFTSSDTGIIVKHLREVEVYNSKYYQCNYTDLEYRYVSKRPLETQK